MAKRKQTRHSTKTRLANRTKQTRTPIANSAPTSVRRPSKPLAEPFHVAVDRQLKSGHETYEAAERVALEIKNRHPRLHVTVFDAKEGRHKVIEQSRPNGASNKTTSASNKNRLAEQNGVARPKAAIARGKH